MKKMATTLSLIFFSLFLIGQNFETEKINVAAGPEDFILDGNQLIIACAERRKENEFTSGIWSLNLDDNSKTKYKLVLEKERKFNPLGISLLKQAEKNYLFVVNYPTKKNPEIICFEIVEKKLIEVKSFQNELIKEPNSLVAISLEEFYFTNDLFISGSVVHYNSGNFKKIIKGINYANGILLHQNNLFVTATFGNKLMKLVPYKGKFKKQKIVRLKTPDNINAIDKDNLLVASHSNVLKFLGHAKNKKKLSPFAIYNIDLISNEKKIIFEDDGSLLSGGSTAIFYKDNLYIAQVFENFILKVNFKK